MQNLIFSEDPSPSVAILIKDTACKKAGILEYYVSPLHDLGISSEEIVAYPLGYPSAKVTVKQARSYLAELLPELNDAGIELIYCADAEYFRQLIGHVGPVDAHAGYVIPCVVVGYEHINCVLGASYTSVFHSPATQTKINQSINTLASFLKGQYLPPGSDLFSDVKLLTDFHLIKHKLNESLTKAALTCDIETLSLHFRDAGICTISFARDTKDAFAFAVDTHGGLGQPIRDMLKAFFENYQGTLIWHNAGYDLKVLVYTLWMKHPQDYEGMLEGIEVMTRNFHDTRLIAYLALNSCARVQYSLKVLAQEFAGNYAEANIENALLIEPEQLMKYNCVDTMATWYVFNKYYQKMIDDNQNDLYEGLFKQSVALLIQIELTGMPLSMEKVLFAEKTLCDLRDKHTAILQSNKWIQEFTLELQQKAYETKQASLKKKIVSLQDFDHVQLNPASGVQLQAFLYEYMQMPVIDKTKKKQPATGHKTLTKLKNHTQDPDLIKALDALVELGKVAKILAAFIPAFKDAWLKADGCHYLHGNFKLGAVVSGRLSCSNVNLQQLPSGSTYGKLIKDCFIAPPGFLLIGADYSSLEDKINTLLTRDTNKMRVYTDGYDGHAYRTKSYWPQHTPDIDYSVASINSMAEKSSPYYALRNKSKAPTFALTFLGTYITLMNNCGFSEAEAKQIEANYHELYKESDAWLEARLKQASKDGYATAAFGLRVRCPLLQQVVWGSKSIPFEAQAESRTLGNAISGQSYGLLNNRSSVEFRDRTLASKYRLDVLPIALIHDAAYMLVRDDLNVVHWVNENLPDCMQWQDLPELQHPTIKLGGEVDIHWNSWAYPVQIKNNASKQEILLTCKTKVEEYKSKIK